MPRDARQNREINQLIDADMSGGQFGNRASPNRNSRFSPDNAIGRGGALAGVLGRAGAASRQSPYGGSRATFSRAAGGSSRAGSVRDPNQMAADVDNININSPDAIERERHLASVR